MLSIHLMTVNGLNSIISEHPGVRREATKTKQTELNFNNDVELMMQPIDVMCVLKTSFQMWTD